MRETERERSRVSYGRPDASLPLAPGSIYRRFRVLPPGQRLVNLPAERLIFQPCPTATEFADFPRGSGPTVSMNGDAYKLAPFHGLASVDPPDLSALDGPTMANKLAGNGPSLPLSPSGVEVSRRSITNRASTRGLLLGFRLHNGEEVNGRKLRPGRAGSSAPGRAILGKNEAASGGNPAHRDHTVVIIIKAWLANARLGLPSKS